MKSAEIKVKSVSFILGEWAEYSIQTMDQLCEITTIGSGLEGGSVTHLLN